MIKTLRTLLVVALVALPLARAAHAKGTAVSANFNTDPTTKTINGCTGLAYQLYRYYSAGQGDHFYTTNFNELGFGGLGYVIEGTMGSLVSAAFSSCGATPLYRYYNGSIGDHFYTTSWSELGAGGSGWSYEGVQGYCFASPTTGTVPLYRYYSGGQGDHFYTTNFGELGGGRIGYDFEGVQCYVVP